MRHSLLQHTHFPYILQAQGMFSLGVTFGLLHEIRSAI